VADYDRTIRTGDQQARYVRLESRPFALLDPGYQCVNPESGDQTIEGYAAVNGCSVGLFTCLNVLEHVRDPFDVFNAFRHVLRLDGYGIVHTPFSFPVHGDPGTDFWRFTPAGLLELAKRAKLRVIESGFRLNLHAGLGILNTQNREPQEVRTVYIVVAREGFRPCPPPSPYPLPQRRTA
jgi:hypothetical protein